MACGILVPPPGIEPTPSAVEAQSLNHRTASEVHRFLFGSVCYKDFLIIITQNLLYARHCARYCRQSFPTGVLWLGYRYYDDIDPLSPQGIRQDLEQVGSWPTGFQRHSLYHLPHCASKIFLCAMT